MAVKEHELKPLYEQYINYTLIGKPIVRGNLLGTKINLDFQTSNFLKHFYF